MAREANFLTTLLCLGKTCFLPVFNFSGVWHRKSEVFSLVQEDVTLITLDTVDA